MMLVPILYAQNSILDLINEQLVNTNSRWSTVQIYSSLNRAISDWHRRVLIPFVYTVPDGFNSTVYSYDLPDYVDGPITPQSLFYPSEYIPATQIDSTLTTWRDIAAYSVERNTAGTQTLRLHHYAYTMDGRVLYWTPNGPVPTTIATLNAGITDTDTSLTLASKPTIGRNGYVYIGSEWIQYSGYTESASTLTLTNLVRGVNNTTAASHLSAVSVYFGVAMDDGRLLNQLIDATCSYLMRHNLMDGATQQADHYEKMMLYYANEAKMFWRSYVPSRPTSIRLSRMSMGV